MVWATGYRPGYSWIQLPVLDDHGLPRHQRGVTGYPGLYFLGMHNQYSRGSSLIHWICHDAQYIVSQARARGAATRPGTGTSDDNPVRNPPTPTPTAPGSPASRSRRSFLPPRQPRRADQPAGLRRTAGTRTAAIARQTAAPTAPTAKARAKSRLPR